LLKTILINFLTKMVL